jgi:hypothetical protein
MEAHPDRTGIESGLNGEADTEGLNHDRHVARRKWLDQ